MDALREWFVDWTPAVQALAALVIAGFTVWLARSTKRYADASDAQLEELRSQYRERREAEGRVAAQALSTGLVRLRERVKAGSCESLEEAFPEWTVVYSTHAPALARAVPELGTHLDECHVLIEKDRDDCFYNRAGADPSDKRTQPSTQRATSRPEPKTW